MAKNLQTSLSLQRLILALAEVHNGWFEQSVGELIRQRRSETVQHDKGQIMRVFLFVWVLGDILACDTAPAFYDLLQLSRIFLYEELAESVAQLLKEVNSR